jgi:chromosome segregation ATPase
MILDPEVLGLILAIVGGAIAWGAERQARKDLERRVSDLGGEVNRRHAEAMADLRPRITRAEEQLAARHARQDMLEERMHALKEQLDRIEGLLASVTRQRQPDDPAPARRTTKR